MIKVPYWIIIAKRRQVKNIRSGQSYKMSLRYKEFTLAMLYNMSSTTRHNRRVYKGK